MCLLEFFLHESNTMYLENIFWWCMRKMDYLIHISYCILQISLSQYIKSCAFRLVWQFKIYNYRFFIHILRNRRNIVYRKCLHKLCLLLCHKRVYFKCLRLFCKTVLCICFLIIIISWYVSIFLGMLSNVFERLRLS